MRLKRREVAAKSHGVGAPTVGAPLFNIHKTRPRCYRRANYVTFPDDGQSMVYAVAVTLAFHGLGRLTPGSADLRHRGWRPVW